MLQAWPYPTSNLDACKRELNIINQLKNYTGKRRKRAVRHLRRELTNNMKWTTWYNVNRGRLRTKEMTGNRSTTRATLQAAEEALFSCSTGRSYQLVGRVPRHPACRLLAAFVNHCFPTTIAPRSRHNLGRRPYKLCMAPFAQVCLIVVPNTNVYSIMTFRTYNTSFEHTAQSRVWLRLHYGWTALECLVLQYILTSVVGVGIIACLFQHLYTNAIAPLSKHQLPKQHIALGPALACWKTAV